MQIECSVIRYWLAASAVSNFGPPAMPLGLRRVEKVRAARHPAVEAAAAERRRPASAAGARTSSRTCCGNRRVVERRGAGLLDGDELARVAVVFHVGKGLHDPLVAADPAQPPADHVKALGHRMDFDADVLRPGHRQKAERRAVVASA